MTWWNGRLVTYDCETTGTDVETDRIVTAAVAFVGGGLPTEEWTVLVNPGVPIPDEAASVHGVTTEMAMADGCEARAGVQAIIAELRRGVGLPLVVMRAPFDLTILDREARRHGLEPFVPGHVVDPFILDKHLDRFRKGSRKLHALCEHHGATLDTAHDAASDAVAAARLVWRLVTQGEVKRRVRGAEDGRELARLKREWKQVRHDLPALHRAQVGWAREQAVSLAEYFARKGEPQDVSPDWPLVPFAEVRAA